MSTVKMRQKNVLLKKAVELRLISSWASQVKLDNVRDLCRTAEEEIRQKLVKMAEENRLRLRIP